MDALTDEALAARLALGDPAPMAILVQRYRRRVFAIHHRATGNREDAEELFQETRCLLRATTLRVQTCT